MFWLALALTLLLLKLLQLLPPSQLAQHAAVWLLLCLTIRARHIRIISLERALELLWILTLHIGCWLLCLLICSQHFQFLELLELCLRKLGIFHLNLNLWPLLLLHQLTLLLGGRVLLWISKNTYRFVRWAASKRRIAAWKIPNRTNWINWSIFVISDKLRRTVQITIGTLLDCLPHLNNSIFTSWEHGGFIRIGLVNFKAINVVIVSFGHRGLLLESSFGVIHS